MPDYEPFAFMGYDNPVYIHQPCGTVYDIVPGTPEHRQVINGECDCESPGPWRRVYVESTTCPLGPEDAHLPDCPQFTGTRPYSTDGGAECPS